MDMIKYLLSVLLTVCLLNIGLTNGLSILKTTSYTNNNVLYGDSSNNCTASFYVEYNLTISESFTSISVNTFKIMRTYGSICTGNVCGISFDLSIVPLTNTPTNPSVIVLTSMDSQPVNLPSVKCYQIPTLAVNIGDQFQTRYIQPLSKAQNVFRLSILSANATMPPQWYNQIGCTTSFVSFGCKVTLVDRSNHVYATQIYISDSQETFVNLIQGMTQAITVTFLNTYNATFSCSNVLSNIPSTGVSPSQTPYFSPVIALLPTINKGYQSVYFATDITNYFDSWVNFYYGNNLYTSYPVSGTNLSTTIVSVVQQGVSSVFYAYMYTKSGHSDTTANQKTIVDQRVVLAGTTSTYTIQGTDALTHMAFVNVSSKSSLKYCIEDVYACNWAYTTAEFPYGYESSIMAGIFNVAITFMTKQLIGGTVLHNYQDASSSSPFSTLGSSSDITPPALGSFQVQPISTYQLLVTFNIVELESGLKYCILWDSIFITAENLIQGEYIGNGTYQVVANIQQLPSYNVTQSLICEDFAYNRMMVSDNQVISMSDPTMSTRLPYESLFSFSQFDVESFTFDKLDVDTTGQSVVNQLVIKFTKPFPTSFKPKLVILSATPCDFKTALEHWSFEGSYNTNDDTFYFLFVIPPNQFDNELQYCILTATGCISGFELSTKFNQILKVRSSNADVMPPMVSAVYSSSLSYTIESDFNFTWQFRIVDNVNGFLRGTINISSTVQDPAPISFNIDPNVNLSSGDKYDGVYTLNLGTKCIDQKFYVHSMELYDTNYVRSLYSVSDSQTDTNLISPLSDIEYLGGMSYQKNLTIAISCLRTLDTVVPAVTAFNLQKPVNFSVSGSVNQRMLNVSFIVTTTGVSGLSNLTNPTVYFTVSPIGMVKFPTTRTVINSTTFNFTVNAIIPYGFGGGVSIIPSIYGITNGDFFTGSYDALSLSNRFGQPPVSATIRPTYTTPVLKSSDDLYNTGGAFSLYGSNLKGAVVYIDVRDGPGFIPFLPFVNEMAILRVNILQFSSSEISVYVSVNGIQSNQLNITAKQRPTTVPPVFTCPVVCRNGGVCQNDATCLCNGNWTGNDCSQTTIIIPDPPKFNETSPNGVIILPGNITTLISVIELNELKFDDSLFKRIPLDQGWIMYNQTNTTDHLKYLYTNLIPNTTTWVNISIEWFDHATTIHFGSKQINIPSSSLKYSVFINQYSYDRPLNTLQLVMDAAIGNSVSKDPCLSNDGTQFDDTGNIKWMKLNFDDKTLYGRFMDIAITDGRSATVTNRLLSTSVNSNGQTVAKIGIDMPHHSTSIILDPTFDHLLNTQTSSTDDKCKSDEPSKLSKTIIIIITVGCVAVAAAIGFTIYRIKLHKERKSNKDMEMRLNRHK